jgi:LPXTG-motif cell wall-anchored protein
MLAISFFSTDNFSGEKTGSILWLIIHSIFPSMTEAQFQPIHFLIRKAAHFTEYGFLALLLFRAFRSRAVDYWRRSWAVYTFLIVVVYASMDEYHQTLTETRTGSINDTLIDISGGLAALLGLWLVRRRRKN